jgi:uncharacterized repeat protein (TIGR01451 family)
MTTFNVDLKLKAAIRLTAALLLITSSYRSMAQCSPVSGQIKGEVFQDANNNGIKENNDGPLNGVQVSLFDASGSSVGSTSTDINGAYQFTGLTNGSQYRVQFSHTNSYMPSLVGSNSATTVQFVNAPSCNASLGLTLNGASCPSNPQIFSTCFVQGNTDINASEATLIGLEHNFTNTSAVTKFASHGQTGSVWGLAWKSSANTLFSSSFVKMYTGLAYGHDAILKTTINGSTYTTSKFAKLSELGISVSPLSNTDINDCAYGNQVGRKGLGAIALSPSEDFLYVVNIEGKSLVKISSSNPTTATTTSYAIPDPGAYQGEYYPFALKYHDGKYYIGVTYAELEDGSAQNSGAVFTFDPISGVFTKIFSTKYLKGYWSNDDAGGITTQHWFTDLDFTDNGNMILSFSDRVGHKFCRPGNNRLDHQFPDILLAWNDAGTWKLESNGKAGTLTGSGVNNEQGPDNGEFFGKDFWVANPSYHPEIALGSVYVLPGTNSVVATVYDPDFNSYSGGMHKYNTTNGNKITSIELYTETRYPQFGKATGFGEIIGRCGLPAMQIGNLVWLDSNKNGIQDAGEQGVSGLKVYLANANCTIIDSTFTSPSGNYLFSNVSAGAQYHITLGTLNYESQYGIIKYNNADYVFTSVVSNDPLNSNAAVSTNCNGNSVVSVTVTGTNHNFDIGLTPATGFDLALKNELVSNQLLRKNDLAEFKITVYNQGGVVANNINVANYIPEGLMYAASNNPDWTLVGNTATTQIPGTLLPGESKSVTIKLSLMSSDRTKIINKAEITTARNHRNQLANDIDSQADNIVNNDNGGLVNTSSDNVITDNGSFDEDDEDPATPNVADLALKQETATSCFYSGDCANINITVYNQGNVPVSAFKVVNYVNSEFNNSPANSAWTYNAGILSYNGGTLIPGQSVTIPVTLCINSSIRTAQIVNYAEIAQFTALGQVSNVDYDSTPDSNNNNDSGGTPNSSQDNNVSGSQGVEEDDHDPVTIGVKYIDLALKLTTTKRRVQSSEKVCFNITVYNQGNEPMSEVDLVDYIPSGLSLDDSRWTLGTNGLATKKVLFPQGFAAGQSHNEEICLVTQDMTNRFYLVNYAEISNAMDMCHQPVGAKDIDSYADSNKSNDLGGVPQSSSDNLVTAASPIDEDDQDPAILINYASNSNSCQCLGNATTSLNGQFSQSIKVRGPKNMTWYIEQVNNLFNLTSAAPPALPTPFTTGPTGYVLSEVSVDSVTSDYVLDGLFEDGKTFQIVLRSTEDDFESITGGGCSYNPTTVTGPASLCAAGTVVYSVPVIAGGYSVSVAGGAITAANADSSQVTITWGGASGTFPLVFKPKNLALCKEPGVLNVAIGSAQQSLACKSNIQLSLDEDCAVEITPSMVIAGSVIPDAPYNVTLLDAAGNMLPSNFVDHSHEGKVVTAKLFEGCSGNTCWGTIIIEDKLGPKIKCIDTVALTCYNFEEYPGPLAEDNCTVIDKVVVLDSLSTLLSCDPKYNMFIHKSYVVMDMHGNKSSICKQVLAIKRIEMDSVKFPKDIEMANAFACNTFTPDKDGHPIPAQAGVPTIKGNSLYPTFDRACNVAAEYKDLDHGIIGNCVRKISRIWTVYEGWCSAGVIRKDTQTIIIADIQAPKFTCPANVTVSASADNCRGTAVLGPVTNITDDCSPLSEITVRIETPNGLILANGGSVTLDEGVNIVKYRISDRCGKTDSCTVTVTVQDKTPPVMICNQGLTVGINSGGNGYIYASNIDDGTFDACGIDSIKIRRLDLGAPCGDSIGFNNVVYFCCADADKTVMVELKAWDINGNANSCMVNVAIQDKTVPVITCPPNDSISCEETYDIANLSRFGTATAVDECIATITSVAKLIPGLCKTGIIERTFTASDGRNSDVCKQTIKIVRKPGSISVDWPEDVTTVNKCNGSSLLPDSLPVGSRRPIITQGLCDQLGAAFKDYGPITFDNGRGSCFIIRREWTVIDWCRKDEAGYEPLVYEQLITGTNTIDPIITLDTVETNICTAQENCNNAPVKLIARASDDCTVAADLVWSYEIDLDYNGTFTADISNNGRGNRIAASGTYKVGNHKIRFTIEDLCGNQVSRDHDFSVRNCNKPVAVCKPGASIALTQMTINGQLNRMACLDMSTLNASSSHPCNEPLKYSYTNNIKDSILCFTCMDIGNRSVTLFATDRFGNQSSCTTTVQVQNNDPSVVQVTSNLDSVCAGAPVVLTAVGAGTIVWSTGQTARTITVNPTQTTLYALSVTSTTDNCTLMASKTITVNPNPIPAITSSLANNSFNLCAGNSIVLTANGGGTYRWNNNSTSTSINVNPTTTTSYSVVVTNQFGCTASATSSVNVIPVSSSVIVASTAGATICAGQSTTLSVTGLLTGTTYTYNWSNGITTATNTVSPATTTTYTVTVTNAAGCTVSSTSTVTVNALPVVNITSVDSVCAGDSINLAATTGFSSYLWTPGSLTTPTIRVRPAAGASTYTVRVTNANGCSNTATKTIKVNVKPTALITGDTFLCNGTSGVLTASGGTSYLWSSGQTTPSITVTGVATTTYFVTVTSSLTGCSSVVSRTVTVGSRPTVTFIGNQGICQGDTARITASGGSSFAWSNNTTSPTLVVNPASTTTYTVTVSSGNTCSNTANVTITVSPKPVVAINPVDTLCAGTPTILRVTGGAVGSTYTWSPGTNSNRDTFLVSPSANTTYSVIVSTNGCTSTATRTVIVRAPIPAVIAANPAVICAGDSSILTITGGGFYTWQSGVSPNNGSTVVVKPTTTTNYTVTVTSNGCTTTRQVTVTVNTRPTATIAPVTAEICLGSPITLTASGGGTYAWSAGTPANTSTITVNSTGTYTVTVTSAQGCTSTASKTVTLKPNPAIDISADKSTVCLGDSSLLTVIGELVGSTYAWSTGATTESIRVKPTVNTSYRVTVTTPGGCTIADTILISVNTNNAPVANCKNITVYLDNTGSVKIDSSQVNNGSAAGCAGGLPVLSISKKEFFCNDAANPGLDTTVLTVTANGLTSKCTAFITLLDTLKPTFTCPLNSTITCNQFTTISALPQPIEITDNCSLTRLITTVLDSTNVCKIGSITRIFAVRDTFGNMSLPCTTKVTITAGTGLSLSNITFPRDSSITTCSSLAPTNFGVPVINVASNGCLKTSVSFTDSRVNVVSPCDYTLARIWTVRDSCSLLAGTSNGTFRDTQFIRVRDLAAPIIGGYTNVLINASECPTLVNIPDANVTITDCNLSSVKNNAPGAVNPNSKNISGYFEAGTTTVTVIATDSCGNSTSVNVTVTVLLDASTDTVFTCVKVHKQIQDTKTVAVLASDYIGSVTGACKSNFRYSFDAVNNNDTLRTFNCSNVGSSLNRIYFFRNNVNIGSCLAAISTTDPNNFCATNIFKLTGNVSTEENQPVEKVVMTLEGVDQTFNTNEDGNYNSSNMVAANYMMKPTKKDGILEGVNTLDLIMIQRHLLGLNKLTSPYKLIAADINNDNKISVSDLVDLRKNILGISDKFTNNDSWKTIDKDFSFANPSNPFATAYPTFKEILDPNGELVANFVGVKIGDVNGSYVAKKNTLRQSNVSITLPNVLMKSSEEVSLPVTVSGVDKIDGLQLSLNVKGLDIKAITSEYFDQDNIHFTVNKDVLSIVLTSDQAVYNQGELFVIKATTSKDAMVSSVLSLDNSTLATEVYADMKPISTNLDWSSQDPFEVSQNTPNPWNEQTQFGFNLPTEGEVKLTISDVKGRVIHTENIQGQKGSNTYDLRSEVLHNMTGVFFYQFQFAGNTQHGKMIRIR